MLRSIEAGNDEVKIRFGKTDSLRIWSYFKSDQRQILQLTATFSSFSRLNYLFLGIHSFQPLWLFPDELGLGHITCFGPQNGSCHATSVEMSPMFV